MNSFKFLRPPIIIAHDGGNIYPEQYFYTMNKVDIFYTVSGKVKVTPKYTIVQRFLPRIYEDKFKPDYERLWYFRSKYNAEYLRDIWKREETGF